MRACARSLQEIDGVVLASPTEVKAAWPGFGCIANSDPQFVEIDLPLDKDFRENVSQPGNLRLQHVTGTCPNMLDFRAFAHCHDRKTSTSQCVADVCKILQHGRILDRNLLLQSRATRRKAIGNRNACNGL